MKKKLLCFTLALIILVGALPMAAFASGDGVTEISTKEQLSAIRNDLSGNYKLVADLVFTDADFEEGGTFYNDGKGFLPIGCVPTIIGKDDDVINANPFTGTLDGNGHVIRGLTIKARAQDDFFYVGLIGINQGTVKNLGLEESSTVANFVQDSGALFQNVEVGSVVAYNQGIVQNCYSTSPVTVSVEGEVKANIGGIVGNNSGTVQLCYNTGSVSGTSTTNYWIACGGIVGYARSAATVASCYSIGALSSTTKDGKNNYTGGIVAFNYGTLSKCYYFGAESAVGREANNTAQTAGELTVDSMRLRETYTDFDFTNDWKMGTANPPLLKVFPCVHAEDDEMVVDKESDCHQTGIGHYVCIRCGEVTRENIVIPTRHAYEKDYDSEHHFEKCTLCGDVANPQVHVFDNACDTFCDCGYVRTVTHDYKVTADETGHFDKCDVCGDIINTEAHTYDSDYDPFCNICQFERQEVLPTPTMENILSMLAKDPEVLLHENSYSLLWTMMISPNAAFDFASEDIKFTSYGMIYSNDKEKLSQYARDGVETKVLLEYSSIMRFAYDEAPDGQFLSRIYKTYLHKITNVPQNKPRFGMSYIRFIYNETVYEVYSPIVEGTITVS